MISIKRNIPNLITLGNLTCGLISIIASINNELFYAGGFIFLGSILDFFDGLSARLLKASSEIGKQLDSMADMVTFGVAPGIVIFMMVRDNICCSMVNVIWMISPVFIIPIFTAIRLAKFNIDTNQHSSFIGLPTPAAAIFIGSLPIISEYNYPIILAEYFNDSNFLIVTSIILSVLLISKLPLFSLKIKKGENWKKKENIIRIIFLISSIILLLIFKFAAIPFIITLYIFLSIINNIINEI